MVDTFIGKKNGSAWQWWNYGRLKFNLIVFLLLTIKLIVLKVLDAKVFFPAAIVFDLFILLFLNLLFTIGYYIEMIQIFFFKKDVTTKHRRRFKVVVIATSLLLSQLFFSSCNSEKAMIEYYQKNKDVIHSIKDLTKEVAREYSFEFLSLRNQNRMGFVLLISIERPFKSMTLSYHRNTFELLKDSIYLGVCDSCTNEEREKYRILQDDVRIKELLRLFKQIEPDAIRVTLDGVFFALGAPLRSSNKSEVQGGIFIPFSDEFVKEQVVKQIEGENAYLYDTVVQ